MLKYGIAHKLVNWLFYWLEYNFCLLVHVHKRVQFFKMYMKIGKSVEYFKKVYHTPNQVTSLLLHSYRPYDFDHISSQEVSHKMCAIRKLNYFFFVCGFLKLTNPLLSYEIFNMYLSHENPIEIHEMLATSYIIQFQKKPAVIESTNEIIIYYARKY